MSTESCIQTSYEIFYDFLVLIGSSGLVIPQAFGDNEFCNIDENLKIQEELIKDDVTLLDVVPHPTSTKTPNYVATLDIAKFSYPDNLPSKNSVVSASPLKQFKDNILFHEIKCNSGLQLTQKYDGSPACVEPGTVFELIKRGWTN